MSDIDHRRRPLEQMRAEAARGGLRAFSLSSRGIRGRIPAFVAALLKRGFRKPGLRSAATKTGIDQPIAPRNPKTRLDNPLSVRYPYGFMNPPDFLSSLPPHLIHATCTYYGNWLPGDPRGFRSEDHRIHSSGDYRSPPPRGEHARLHAYAQRAMKGEPIVLTESEREIVGAAFLSKVWKIKREVIVLAAAPRHLHILYHADADDARRDLARAKQYASHQLESRPGRLWATGESIVRVRSLDHANRTLPYIAEHEVREGAFVWIAPQFDRAVREYLREKLRRSSR